jgi:hypothetical protein
VSLQFPNVPNLPGVPQVARSILAPVTQVVIGAASIQNLLASASAAPNIWGVFDSNGNQVITPDSIREFGTRAEWRVSNFPVQQGSFASYNKVTLPAEYSVRMVKGGTIADRQAFQAQVEMVAASLDLYTIITPEESYQNVNVTRYEITRKGAAEAFFVSVDLFFQLIIQVGAQYSTTTTTPDTSNAASPSAQPNQSQGTVTAQPADPIDASDLQPEGIG